MTIADLEYIVRYLTNESISPQLAMRRIKSFEALKIKLEDTSSQETISELESQLKNKEYALKEELAKKEQEVQKILNEKSSIESEKHQLENLSDLFDSEREELRNQLKLMQEMQEQVLEDPITSAPTDDKLLESIARFQIDLNELVREKSELKDYLHPISEVLDNLIEDPSKYNFNQNKYISHLPTKQEISKTTPQSQATFTTPMTPKTVVTTSSKKTVMKKPDPIVKSSGPSSKVLQILNLFVEFVGEAQTDKDFRNRVETVCDMDEAYENLGGIGLSQLYSFASKDLSKKEEFMKLIESWKVEGVPR
jgi:hypothetical protein